MSEEQRRILNMLAEDKISVEEAEKLLNALSEKREPSPDSSSKSQKEAETNGMSRLKYLRVMVEPAADSPNGERVNIRVPLNLIRAGLKWAAFMPKHARHRVDEALSEKGIDLDFNQLTKEDLEELMVHLNDLTIDVEGKETIKIFCE
jgi:hypothetical protein